MGSIIMRLVLVRLKESMFVCPLIMFFAKISRINRSTTKTSIKCTTTYMNTIYNLMDSFRSYTIRSTFPEVIVALLHVFTIARPQSQILYSIVCSITIYMMNALISFKWSPKMLFHNIPMMQHSSPVDSNAKIAKWTETRLAPFCTSWIWRKFIGSMSEHPRRMHLTDATFYLFQNLSTSFNLTLLSGNHKSNYNIRVKGCQV